jgi:hypothetical protein
VRRLPNEGSGSLAAHHEAVNEASPTILSNRWERFAAACASGAGSHQVAENKWEKQRWKNWIMHASQGRKTLEER